MSTSMWIEMGPLGGPISQRSLQRTQIPKVWNERTNTLENVVNKHCDRARFGRLRVRCAVSSTGRQTEALDKPVIPTPPATYDHRKQLFESSRALISQRWPELSDLAESGETMPPIYNFSSLIFVFLIFCIYLTASKSILHSLFCVLNCETIIKKRAFSQVLWWLCLVQFLIWNVEMIIQSQS